MEGFIIESTRRDTNTPSGHAPLERTVIRWIGIAASARDLLDLLDSPTARVVDSGPDVLAYARSLGVKDGKLEILND